MPPAQPQASRPAALPDLAFIDLLPTPAYAVDAQGRLLRWNRHAVEVWGSEPRRDDPAQRYCGAFRILASDGTPLPRERNPVGEVLRSGAAVRGAEAVCERPDGSRRLIVANVDPFTDGGGAVIGAINVFVDISHRQRLHETIAEQERRLDDSEARYRALAEGAPQLVWTADPQGRGDFFNARWCEYTGQTAAAAAGDGWAAALHPDDAERVRAAWSAAVASGAAYQIEARLRRAADGAWRWFLVRAWPRRDVDGRVVQWLGASTDIHEQRELTESLRRTEARLAAALAAARIGTWHWDIARDVVSWDASLRAVVGIGDAPMPSGSAFAEWIHPEDRERTGAAIREALAGVRDYEVEFRLRHADGSMHWHRSRGRVERRDGVPVAMIGACIDVTEVRSAQRALEERERDLRATLEAQRQAEQRLRRALGAGRMVAWTWDPGRDEVTVSDSAAQVSGLPPDRPVVGMDACLALVHPDDREAHAQRIRDTLANGGGYHAEFRMRRPDNGGITWLDERAEVVTDVQGRRMLTGLSMDVTALKEREERLRASEGRYRSLVDGARHLIWACDAEGTPTFINEAWCAYAGFDRAQAMERHLEIVHPDDLPEVLHTWRAAVAERRPWSREYRLRRRDGAWRWWRGSCWPTIGAAGDPIGWQGMAVDIDEQREAQDALRRSEEFTRGLAEAIPQLVWTLGPDGRFTFANRRWSDYTGLDLAASRVTDWRGIVHPDDYERVMATWADAIAAAEPYEVEFRLRRAADGAYRWFLVRAWPRFGADGRVEQWFGSSTDVHDRREALETLRGKDEELERRARDLQRSNEELEQFAYVAAHDLQEPTRMIVSYLQLVERRLGDRVDAQARTHFDFVKASARRMQDMVRSILEYSRIGKEGVEPAPVSAAQAVRAALRNLEAKIAASGASVRVGELPEVLAIGPQLERLFQNLISNAVKFRSDASPAVEITAERAGGGVVFAVRDNGIGIRPDEGGRLFGLFQRLHARYPGTGIGLASCKKIVEQHGGRIWFEPAPGGGTVFRFTLG